MLRHVKALLFSLVYRVLSFFYDSPRYTIEKTSRYVVITLLSGLEKSRVYLPVRKTRLDKVFLCREGKLIDITHPHDIDYFLTLDDLQGEYFLVKKNNAVLKVKDLKDV